MKESKTETGPICSNGPVKISVIGNVMLDSYIKKGHTEEKYGGILYVISTLSVLFDKQARIYPITII
ncbi:MAG: hypothetical protein KKH98_15070, partial [Spirochaetes bacterium]|nr:hypothetical protein [Spirochaetota bacterium]